MTQVITYDEAKTWAEQFIARKPNGEVDLLLTQEQLPRSDLVSARVVKQHFDGMIHFGTQTAQWYLWDGVVHRPANGGEIESVIHRWADTLKEALNRIHDDYELRAASAPTPQQRDQILQDYARHWKAYRAYRDRLFNDAGQKAVISQMRSICATDESKFDSSGRYFVVENGVINMDVVQKTRKIVLMAHDPARMLTKRSNVVWDPDAKCGWWEWYIRRSLPDAEVRRYLQRWAGSSLLGLPNSKGLVNLIGPQDSGKSIFLDTMISIIGDYAKMVRASTFLAKKPGDAGYDLHELRGARFVAASEPGQGKFLDDDAVKTLTGGDAMRTREPYGRFVAWKPQCTIFIASNQPMRLDTADGAMLNRIKPIIFPKSFRRDKNAPEEERAEPNLAEWLSHERAGIFRWIVDGLIDFLNHGLGDEPNTVSAGREQMALEMATPLEWLEEMLREGLLVEDPEAAISRCAPVRKSFHQYRMWCAEVGVMLPMQERKFAAILSRKYPKQTSGGIRLTGLRWNDEMYHVMESRPAASAPASL